MNVLAFLIPVSLVLGLGGLAGFVWTLRHRQYEDIEGAARRILMSHRDAAPEPDRDA
jgi:cbb3-type cytochrome oxidase maturation protein